MRGSFGARVESGRWIRQGGRIVVLPADGGAGGGPQGELEVVAPLQWTLCDFIDSRIDVAAQYALSGLMRRRPLERIAALLMLSAVKNGMLAGIYQENQLEPAKRAKLLGTGWWNLIPGGSQATCIRGPAGQIPMIVFRRSLASNHFALGTELARAWSACGISTPPAPPPSGKPCTKSPAGAPVGLPVIQISGHTPSFILPRDSSQPGTAELFIRNTGGGTLNWIARVFDRWLSVNPGGGHLTAASGYSRLTLTADATGFPVGTYTTRIEFSATRAANSPQTVTAELVVIPPPPP